VAMPQAMAGPDVWHAAGADQPSHGIREAARGPGHIVLAQADVGFVGLPDAHAQQFLCIAAVGLSINTWFSWSQAPTVIGGVIQGTFGFVIEGAAFFLPDQAAQLFRARRWVLAAIAGLLLFPLTLVFAVNNSIGFASTNLSETTMARAARVTPEVEVAQRAADAATAARLGECTKRGPRCRDLEAQEQTKLTELGAARGKIAAQADPQAIAAAKLVSWLSRGGLTPSTEDYRMLVLLLWCLCPQIGGLVLMVARR